MVKAFSLTGINALVFDETGNRVLSGLDDLALARDAETFSPDLGMRLVFVRDVDPEDYLDSDQKTIAVVDLAPDREDVESLDMLRRFDAVWGLSHWVVDDLHQGGVDAKYIGRVFEPAEQAYLPRSHFELPDSAHVIVLPLDADEFFSPCADEIHETYVQALLASDTKGQLRIAIIASADQLDVPDFPDDPRVSLHDLTGDDYLADSLLNTADCVVSFDTHLRVAKSLGRAEWLGCPVLAIGASADSDLVGLSPLTIAEDADTAQIASQFVQKTLAVLGRDRSNSTAPDFPAGQLLTESSYRAVALRLTDNLIEIAL